MIKEIIGPIQPFLPYLVIAIALYFLIKFRYPSCQWLTGLAFLALVMSHVQC